VVNSRSPQRHKGHKDFRAFLLLLAILVVGCAEKPKSAAGPQPVAIRILKAAYEPVPDVLEVPGSVEPRNRIVLSSQINGFVREVRVRAGDSVRAGQVLITLDARETESQRDAARASIEEAKAALEEARRSAQAAASMRASAQAAAVLAESTFQRYQKLFADRSVSAQELDEARARRDMAAADLAAKELMETAAGDRPRQLEARITQANAQSRRAEVLVSWTVVSAPSAGRVVERRADPGSAIFPGSPLLVLESITKPQVLAEIPSTRSGLLRAGLEVRVKREGPASSEVTGRVSEIIPHSDPATHSLRFKVDLPDDFAAPSGTFVKVGIPAGDRRALLVPQKAVRETGQLTGVFVADSSSIARFRLVKLAVYASGRAEVLAGVEPGERIVEDPGDRVFEGTPLEIRP
jgi:multidrug efflux pump subunit AcrA (membrane-fusion protein)